MSQIVVGVKSSLQLEPLAWAIDQARLTDSSLFVMHAWAGHVNEELPDPPRVSLAEAQVTLAEALRAVRLARIKCDGALHPGFAGYGLVTASSSAGLLVVGSSQRSLISRSLRGSTALYCVLHSKCPVVAVPVPDVRGRGDQPG